MKTIVNPPHLTETTLEMIKNTLQTELLKRGFLAPITLSEDTSNYPRIEITSEPFQTVPVIMKSLRIDNHGGSIKEETKTRKKYNNEEYEQTIYRIWIPVHVSYEHFEMGSNGCSLFNLTGWVTNDESDGRIYELIIS